MSAADKIRLQRENDNLLAVMLYAYEEPKFLQYNIGFIKACFEEWYRSHKKLSMST
jgi:hypothetical protein